MLFGIRMSCQRQEKVGISWNTCWEPLLCYRKCWWFRSITPIVQQLQLVHNMRQRYSLDFAIPYRNPLTFYPCAWESMGNISLKAEAFRQIGVWVYDCETSVSSQYRNYFKCASYLLRTLYASKSGSLFKAVARSTWLWAQLRQGKQGKKLTGRPERWKGHSVFIWDPQLHCDTSTVMPLNNFLNELHWA